MQTMSPMPTGSPIMYPLFSAEEVVFVEDSLKVFRAKTAEKVTAKVPEKPQAQTTPVPSALEWKQMTKAQKLSMIELNWDLGGLRDLKPWVMENATVLAVMDLCAQSPGGWVTFKSACAEANMQYFQGRGQMQAMTKKRNQMGKGTWPMLAEAAPPGKIGLAYQMSPAIASLWKQVRSEP